ncbi:MAG: DUF4405 domain-containing protein [Deltaproteobacteria bacterium]|nr:DUF4405 domain-containing protein [Deltaproteobacteria bacterium]
MKTKRWNGRAFTSLCSLVSFILLCVTGIVLYLEPQGRVAYWIEWQFLSLEKDQWGNIHIYAGLLFLIAGGFHIYYNWKPLIKYVSGRIESALRYKRELAVGCTVFVWIVVSGIWSLPPLVYVTDLGGAIKDAWVTSPELEPPFGHAELVSLKTFCLKQRIPLDQAVLELRNAGFTVDSPRNTVAQIAASKQTSGMGVYAVIKKLEANPAAMQPGERWTAEKVEEAFAGTGLGNKTIGQLIKEMKLDKIKVYQRLSAIDIEVQEGDTLRGLAEKNNTTPIVLMTSILVDDRQVEE